MAYSGDIVKIDTDVLIVGGGLAGCMAAFGALQEGGQTKITVVDKSVVRRSGAAATGLDNFRGVYPEGDRDPEETPENFAKEYVELTEGIANQRILEIIGREMYPRMLFFEKLGIPIRDKDGKLVVSRLGGKRSWVLQVEGGNMKPIFDQALREQGVEIVNRVMITKLRQRDGKVCGAIGFNVRTGERYVFNAKTVILTSGPGARVFKTVTGVPFHVSTFPRNTADGHVMAYNIGAQLVNMEFGSALIVPKGFPVAGLGRALMVGANLINAKGERVMQKYAPDRLEQGSHHTVAMSQAVAREIREGNGPCFLDFTHLSQEKIDDYFEGLANERPVIARYYSERGIDLSKDPVEFEPAEIKTKDGGGILVDEFSRASIPSLYAAGDAAGGIGYTAGHGSVVMGWRAGAHATGYAKTVSFSEGDEQEIADEFARYDSLLNREAGITPVQLEQKLQKEMTDYVGFVRSEVSMKAALKRIAFFRELAQSSLGASDPHQLMLALEACSAVETAEMIIRSAIYRKESRSNHFRIDYPKRNDDEWLKYIVVKRSSDDMALSTKELAN